MTKHGSRFPLNAEYHDGVVEAIELGPRREVILTVRLDPVWNNGDGTTRRLHFSAIQNFDEVSGFFGRAGPVHEGAKCVDEILGIVRVAKGVIGIDLDHLGYLELRGAKVREL
jgi:hypothetical protein